MCSEVAVFGDCHRGHRGLRCQNDGTYRGGFPVCEFGYSGQLIRAVRLEGAGSCVVQITFFVKNSAHGGTLNGYGESCLSPPPTVYNRVRGWKTRSCVMRARNTLR